MIKNQAINTFQEGLVMDFNPLATPNNVLTSCLNGTLITFNGNENVLQNDMGNGRIETAYLPEGYIPLGTCSLGGIIYIASYNPFENKCQLGSFPSPERTISSEELNPNKISFDFSQFYRDPYSNNISDYSFLIELSPFVFNAGDKFKIYTSGNVENKSLDISSIKYSENFSTGNNKICAISNCVSETDTNKLKAVKITPVVITNNGSVIELINLKNVKISNDYHYYIAHNDTEDSKLDIDNYRTLLNSGYDIFNSKLSGKLALQISLEIPDTFDVSIKATRGSDEGKYNILYTATVQSTQKIDIDGLELKDNIGTIYQTDKNDSKWKIARNLENLDSSKYIYTITPIMTYGILDIFSRSGNIDLSKIGSGIIDLKEWNYYIDSDNITLNIGFEAYPEEDKQFKDIKLEIINLDTFMNGNPSDLFSSSKVIDINKNLETYSSLQQIINITSNDLEKNNIYIIRISVGYYEGKSFKESRIFYRTIFTTGQWNNEYVSGNVLDFKSLSLSTVLSPEILSDITDNLSSKSEIIKLASTQDDEGYQYDTINWKNGKPIALYSPNYYVHTEVKDSNYQNLFSYKSNSCLILKTSNSDAISSTFTYINKGNTEKGIFKTLNQAEVSIEETGYEINENSDKFYIFPVITKDKLKQMEDTIIIDGPDGQFNIFGQISTPIGVSSVSMVNEDVNFALKPIVHSTQDLEDYAFTLKQGGEITSLSPFDIYFHIVWRFHEANGTKCALQQKSAYKGNSDIWNNHVTHNSVNGFWALPNQLHETINNQVRGCFTIGVLNPADRYAQITFVDSKNTLAKVDVDSKYMPVVRDLDDTWHFIFPATEEDFSESGKFKIGKRILSLLAQLYRIVEQPDNVYVEQIDALIEPQPYTETWKYPIISRHIITGIKLKNYELESILNQLNGYDDLKKNFEVSGTNNQIEKEIYFNHIFKINTTNLIEQNSKKNEYIKIYYNNGEEGIAPKDFFKKYKIYVNENNTSSWINFIEASDPNAKIYKDVTISVENNLIHCTNFKNQIAPDILKAFTLNLENQLRIDSSLLKKTATIGFYTGAELMFNSYKNCLLSSLNESLDKNSTNSNYYE